MLKLVGLGLWWLSLAIATMVVQHVFEQVPLWGMVLASAALATAGLPLAFGRQIKGWWARRYGVHSVILDSASDLSDFDVPIRDAIEHVVETSAHTFNNSGDAERRAFEALHKEMCADKLPVIGMLGDFNVPERISARKCSELRPQPVVVPRNPTSPNGVLFALIDETKIDVTPLVERSDPLGFTGLRVRSTDLYVKWPKDQECRLEDSDQL